MHFGIQLYAPVGFDGFRQGVRYYYAGGTADGSVHLAWFSRSKSEWRVYLVTIPRVTLTHFLQSEPPKLVPYDDQHQTSAPEWLLDVEGVNFDALEGNRPRGSRTYRSQVEARLSKISLALESESEILAAANPLSKLSAIAYSAGSSVHPYRVQLWFYAYILHGQDVWALKKPTQGTGRWLRSQDKHKGKKFGARSTDTSTCFNSPSGPHEQACGDHYLKECGKGVRMTDIWRSYLRSQGVIEIKDSHGNETFHHPKGGPILSYGQYRYQVVKRFTLAAVQLTLYGAARARSKAKADKGNFTKQYANVLEGFEVDAYYCSDRPKAMFSDAPAERLAVARGLCAKTAEVCGVGFSIGSETGEAYRAMLFCAAVPKTYIAKIYGIPGRVFSAWLNLGMPPNMRSDRGPAGHRKLVLDLERQFPMKTIVPSYSGQSKAQVESGHPRDIQDEGAPSYVQSDLNIVQMMKRELLRANADNHKRDISDRLDPREIADFYREGRLTTPHHYADYLVRQLSTDGRTMSVEQAVRAYWTPTSFEMNRTGVVVRGHSFSSDQFRESGIYDRMGGLDTVPISGFYLSAVMSTVWVEVAGGLIEVSFEARGRVDAEDHFIPMNQLEETQKMLRAIKAKSRSSGAAAQSAAERTFQDLEGKGWNAGKRVGGTPNMKCGTGKHEADVVKGKSRVNKAA